MVNSKFIQFDKHLVNKNKIVMIEQINHFKVRVTTSAVRNGENINFETNYEFEKIVKELSEWTREKK